MTLNNPDRSRSRAMISANSSPNRRPPPSLSRSVHHPTCLANQPHLLIVLVGLLDLFLAAKNGLNFLRGKLLLIGLRRRRKRIGFLDRPHYGLIKGVIPRGFHQFHGKNLTVRLYAEPDSGAQPRLLFGDDPALLHPSLDLLGIHDEFEPAHQPSSTLTWGAADGGRARATGLAAKSTLLFALHL